MIIIIPHLLSSPVLVAPGAHVLHRSEAAGDARKAVEVVQDGAAGLQVVRVTGGLGGPEERRGDGNRGHEEGSSGIRRDTQDTRMPKAE